MLRSPLPSLRRAFKLSEFIDACVCVSGVQSFVATNLVAVAGVALAGNAYVVNEVTGMVCMGCFFMRIMDNMEDLRW